MKQLAHLQGYGSKAGELSSDIKVNGVESPRNDRRPPEEEMQSNNRKIAKIQEEMMNMRDDVSRLKDVIIDQRVYIS